MNILQNNLHQMGLGQKYP